MRERLYEEDVFVNCPLDADYRPLFDAIVFTIHDCGYAARSALEVTDTSQIRIEKISGSSPRASSDCTTSRGRSSIATPDCRVSTCLSS